MTLNGNFLQEEVVELNDEDRFGLSINKTLKLVRWFGVR
jgi:hypothetical protein